MTLEIITSDSLAPLRHGFFTRKGGASSGVFAGLNCGFGSSDQTDVVQINRARVASAMAVAPDSLVTVHQTHSSDVAVIQSHHDGTPVMADALVTKTEGLALAVLAADCQPVLFVDHNAGVIGAAHAGWKGTLNGVLENTLSEMEKLGAQRDAIQAVIGPCISQRAYEVGPEFLDAFLDADAAHQRFFVNGKEDRYQFDLPGLSLHRLRAAGVHAEWTRHCTYSDEDRFFSYRRATHAKEADYGRLISCIRL